MIAEGHPLLGITLVVVGGIVTGLLALLFIRDLIDALTKAPLLAFYACTRLGGAFLIWPILKLLLQNKTYETVQFTFDSAMFLIGLILLAIGIIGILINYPRIRDVMAQVERKSMIDLARRKVSGESTEEE